MRAILGVIKKISRRIAERESKLFHLRNLMGAVVPEFDGMPKKPNVSSRVERLAVSITDLEREISELKAIRVVCRIEFCEWLYEKISDDDVCSVLFYRYGLLKKFSVIASELNYSESSVFRLHRTGLKILGVQVKLSDDYEFDA